MSGATRPRQPPTETPPIDSKQIAASAAYLADQKKAADIQVLDLSGNNRMADYFVIVTGLSRPQIKAIYNEIHTRLKAAGQMHGRAEGYALGWWVLMDYGNVVVHVMQPEAREYYDLESLYAEAPAVDWQAVELPELPIPKSVYSDK